MFEYAKRMSRASVIVLIVVAAPVVRPVPADAQTTRPAEPPPPTRVERRTFIAAPQQRVWDALCQKKLSDAWFPFPLAEADLQAGGRLVYGSKDDPILVCDVVEIAPPRRLSLRFKFHGGPIPLQSEPPTRVTYTLRGWGPTTELHLVHDELEGAPFSARTSPSTWDSNLARLKTLLETGKPLVFSYQEAAEQIEADTPWEPPDRYNPLAFVRGITLYVADLKEARPWYEKAFGLSLSGFSRDWITLSMARPAITVREAMKPGERPGQVALQFRARDVDRLYRRLKDEGVEFVQPLTDRKYVKEFTFVGPGGYRFMVQGPAVPPPASERAATTRPAGSE